MNTIFVYGLLKPGFSLYRVAEPFVERAADAHARGRLYDAGVPAARFDLDGRITGHIFWIVETKLDEALARLDELEDEGEQYRRITIEAQTTDGVVQAHAYHYLQPLDGCPDVGDTWTRNLPR